MTKDALEKLIESVVDCSRAYQHALDQGPESEAVAYEAELNGAKAKLLAALAPETGQPEGTGYYDLTIRVGVYRDSSGYETVTCQNNGSRYLSAETKDITGTWRKVEP